MSQERKFAQPTLPLTYREAVAVTPDNTNTLSVIADAIFVGGAGTVALVTAAGTSTTFTVAASTLLPLAVTQVKSTGTNSTGIVALYL